MNDFYGDSAYTFAVGEISGKKQRLLDAVLKNAKNKLRTNKHFVQSR